MTRAPRRSSSAHSSSRRRHAVTATVKPVSGAPVPESASPTRGGGACALLPSATLTPDLHCAVNDADTGAQIEHVLVERGSHCRRVPARTDDPARDNRGAGTWVEVRHRV